MSFSSFTADLSLELLVWWSVVLFVSLGALILFVATRTPLRSSKVGSDSSSRPSREMEGLSEISTTSEVPCHKSFQKWCPQQVNYFGDKISGNHSFGVLQFWAPVISIHIICYIYTYLPPLPLSLSLMLLDKVRHWQALQIDGEGARRVFKSLTTNDILASSYVILVILGAYMDCRVDENLLHICIRT